MKDRSTQQLIQSVRSGIIHIEFLNQNEVIGSGSAFLARNYLITNNHVYAGTENASTVKLSWQLHQAPQSLSELSFPTARFKSYFKAGSDENNHDYAILDIPDLRDKNLYQFTLASHKENNICDEILILGFPFEHQNLVCHKGSISSFYTRNNIDIIQLDASVNSSNSGGPLVDLKTGNVIGIVTRKGTGLSKLFDELLDSFDQNISFFDSQPAGISLGHVNPVTALKISQMQMKRLAQEIIRSANVGIGYAFSVEHIETEIKRLEEDKD